MSARSMVLAIKPSCFRTQRRVKGHRFFIVSLLNHCSDKLKAHHENHWSTCEHSHWTEGTWFLNGNPTQRNKTASTLETSLGGHLRLISSWNWQRWIAIPFLSYACFLLKSFNIIQHLQVSFSVNLFREKKADDVVQIFDYTGYYQILFPCITGTYFIKEKVIFPVVLQHS